MLKRRQQRAMGSSFGLKAMRVDSTTENRKNESFSVSSDSSTVTDIETVADLSVGPIKVRNPKPNISTKNINIFSKNNNIAKWCGGNQHTIEDYPGKVTQ